MLMCLDVGNTHVVMGVFDKEKMLGSFRFSTERNRTGDRSEEHTSELQSH